MWWCIKCIQIRFLPCMYALDIVASHESIAVNEHLYFIQICNHLGQTMQWKICIHQWKRICPREFMLPIKSRSNFRREYLHYNVYWGKACMFISLHITFNKPVIVIMGSKYCSLPNASTTLIMSSRDCIFSIARRRGIMINEYCWMAHSTLWRCHTTEVLRLIAILSLINRILRVTL
jgi:hypothetical protein